MLLYTKIQEKSRTLIRNYSFEFSFDLYFSDHHLHFVLNGIFWGARLLPFLRETHKRTVTSNTGIITFLSSVRSKQPYLKLVRRVVYVRFTADYTLSFSSRQLMARTVAQSIRKALFKITKSMREILRHLYIPRFHSLN